MKKILIAFLSLSLGITGAVQAQQDPKAKSILESVSQKIKELKSLKADFTLQLTGANSNVQETRKGSVMLKGQKYRVNLAGQEIICDNKTIWTYFRDMNEVQINTYNPDAQAFSPAKLFTSFYDKEYKYKYAGQRKVNGKTCDIIELTPSAASAQFSKIELAVDNASKTIVGGNIWEKNGNRFQYSISGFTPNASIGDDQFVFNASKYPGVEVVDLR